MDIKSHKQHHILGMKVEQVIHKISNMIKQDIHQMHMDGKLRESRTKCNNDHIFLMPDT